MVEMGHAEAALDPGQLLGESDRAALDWLGRLLTTTLLATTPGSPGLLTAAAMTTKTIEPATAA